LLREINLIYFYFTQLKNSELETYLEVPPSIGKQTPVTYLASSDAKYK